MISSRKFKSGKFNRMKKMSTIIIALITIVFIAWQNSPAQQFHKSERNADIVEYTHQEGLPTTEINDLVKTRDGYIWMSGSEGTYRFDGYNFDEVGQEIGLPKMQAMYYDSTNNFLYFASPEKFITFDGNEYRSYGKDEGYFINGMPGQVINFVRGDSKGRIWIGSETNYVDKKNNGGLTLFQDGKFTVFDSLSYPLDNTSDFIETPYGDLIFASSGHNTQTREGAYIALYKNGVFKRIDESMGFTLQDANLSAVRDLHAIDKEGNTWIAFSGTRRQNKENTSGVLMYNGKEFHQFPGMNEYLSFSRFPIAVYYSKGQEKVFASIVVFGGLLMGPSNKIIFEFFEGRWKVADFFRKIKHVRNLKTGKIISDFKLIGGSFAQSNRFFPEVLTLFPSAPTVSSKYPNQLFTFTGKDWVKYDAFQGFPINETDEGLVLRTAKGFGFYYPNHSKMLTDKDGLLLTQSGIPDLYSDRNGIVWISYSYTNIPAYAKLANVGMNVWDGKTLRKITKKDGLPSNITFDTYQDTNERVWIPTAKGLATAREILNSEGEWIFKFEKVSSNGKYNYNVSDIKEMSNGDIYAWQNYVRPGSPKIKSAENIAPGSNELTPANYYLSKYNGKEFSEIVSPFGDNLQQKAYHLYRLYENIDGKIWLFGIFTDKVEELASSKSILKIYDGENWEDPSIEWNMPDEQLHYVGKIKEKSYYLTVDGFYQFDGIQFTNLIDSISAEADFTILKGASVAGTSTEIQSNDRLYIRLRRKGLVVFDGEKIEYFTRKNGLPSVNLSNPNTDERGHLFFGTPSGALIVEDNNFLPYYDDESMVSGGAYSSTMDLNNDLVLFYNGVGLFIAKMENKQYQLKISSVKVNSTGHFYTFPPDLEYDQNSFVFNYAAFNFKNPRQTLYEHILEGYDLSWSRANNLSFSEYQNLPHGSYEFKVKGVTANGTSTDEASYAFIIHPPIWQTWYAYFSYAALFGLMLLSIRSYEKRRLRLKDAEKRRREKNEVRVRESELRAKAAELQAKAAEAQNRAMQAENDRKTKELEEARELQLSLLPKNIPDYPGIQISAYMKTATEVGGDYYDFSIKRDGSLNVAIGDATGHGMKAGTLVTAMKALFSSGSTEVDIKAFFESVNMGLKKMQMERVMMSFAMLNINGNRIKMINAGMPPVFHYSQNSKEVAEIKVNGMPLGAMERSEFDVKEIALSKGDCLLMLSDGMPELRNREDEMFGYERLASHFGQVADKSADEIIEYLKNAGSDWVDDKDPEDDVTFVVVKII